MIKGIAQRCANHSVELQQGNGPHAYQLWCTVCNKHVQWISASDAFYITRKPINTTNKTGERDGNTNIQIHQ